MAHSLSNGEKEQFMSRSASYSTHGSRRGYVDDCVPVLGVDENREALAHQQALKSTRLGELKKLLGIRGKVNPHRPVASEHRELLSEAVDLAREITRLNQWLKDNPRPRNQARLPPRDWRDAMLQEWEAEFPDRVQEIRVRAKRQLALANRKTWKDVPGEN